MSCGISVIKYILFLVNIICAIAGIALIALGAVVITQAKHIQGADIKSFNVVAGFIIGLGCLIFIIAFFGCCGAIRESHCMTMTYAIVLLVLLIAEIAVIAYVFISNTKGGEIFDDLWKNRDKPEVQTSINAIQSFGNCCGKYGPGDYMRFKLPNSCCKGDNVTVCLYSSSNLHLDGCDQFVKNSKVYETILNYTKIIFSVIGVITLLKCCGNQGSNDYDIENLPPTCCEDKSKIFIYEESYKIGCHESFNYYAQKFIKIIGIGFGFGLLFTHKCCGKDYPQDYITDHTNRTLVPSCCPKSARTCELYGEHYERGCSKVYRDVRHRAVNELGYLTVGLTLFESKCCGKDGVEDYFIGENRTLPNSCCHPKIENCTAYITNYSSGCKQVLDLKHYELFGRLLPCLFFVLLVKWECCGQNGPEDYNQRILQPSCCPMTFNGTQSRACLMETPHFKDGCTHKLDVTGKGFKMLIAIFFGGAGIITVGCCGKDGPFDYGPIIPQSCCPGSENVFSCALSAARQNGCHHAFEDFMKKNFKILGFVGIGVAVFEAVAFIFACTLANHVRNNERRSHY